MVTLEQWNLDFISPIARYADNPKIAANLRDGFPQPYTLADAEAYVTGCIEKGEDGQLCRAIAVDGKAAGSIGVFLREQGQAELGYWLAEPYWGKGIMTRAVERICREAFSRFRISRIFAVPYTHNAASRRVLEKAGFRFGGYTESCGCTRGQVCIYTLDKSSETK